MVFSGKKQEMNYVRININLSIELSRIKVNITTKIRVKKDLS